MKNEKEILQFCFFKTDFENGKLKFDSVLKKFEKVAVSHAQVLGAGFDDMIKQNLLWVTLRIKYTILKQPLVDENLVLTTFASNKTTFEFDRDFIIKNGQEVLIKGTSKWCLIDKNTRKIAKLNDIHNFDNIILNSVFQEKFLKTEIFETENLLPEFIYSVKKEDIDKNGHMNNTVYAKIINKFSINDYKFFQINFLKEAMLNENINIYKKFVENKIIIVGLLGDKQICFSAEIY